MKRLRWKQAWWAGAGAAVLAALAVVLLTEPADVLRFGHDPALPTLTLVTSPMVTTPQIPFWAAYRSAGLQERFNLEVRVWRTPDALQSLVLAGRGDLWIGHVDGFARAWRRGAPVALLAVTGWRKFYLLSRRPDEVGLEQLAGTELAYTPAGSPAVPLLRAVLGPDADLRLQPHETRQLSLLLLRGAYDTVLAPEPLVTMLLEKVQGLQVVTNIESAYGLLRGHGPRVPLAGVAVNRRAAAKYPGEIEALLDALLAEAERLSDSPAEAAALLPEAFGEFLNPGLVTRSLERDPVLARRAADVQDEIRDYLEAVAPDAIEDAAWTAPGRGFLWHPRDNR